ncbi:MAG: Asp-tRNA(Asn)/Glu-tRNA(Gln) amidotransferase subunit GatB [Gemmatimonadales bacterium]|nr:MAG: Asp-tRNA(Asn)/Glu-tRNA(Gln) amidotransferase subunit GatB [Gemmatimonadales bacterium]
MEAVIGLEIHVQLRTREKLFCADVPEFGVDPNTRVCPVCLGLPGALPVLNREAVELAMRAALGFGCTIHQRSVFERKNYFYPDLPKGYQISQFEEPLATGGLLEVRMGEDGQETFPVRIRRMHLEEDAGKSIHDRVPDRTAVDLNRTGTPLVEMVSEPDLRSPAQVRAYLDQVKRILEYLDVSDCNMEEGSLRVDANVSIRPRGSRELGTKTELKNLNSFSGVERALEVEIARQVALVRSGGQVTHETLLWDERRQTVRSMRSKEDSQDYRYFPDPDLPPVLVSPAWIQAARDALPELPEARRTRFVEAYSLPAYDAGVLTARRPLADFYEAVVRAHSDGDAKEVANWVMGPVLALANTRSREVEALGLEPEGLAELLALVSEGRVNRRAARTILERMVESGAGGAGTPEAIMEAEGLAQVSDDGRIQEWVHEVVAAHPDEVARFRSGERRLQGFFMGEVMKRSRGKADPGEVARILGARLKGV